MPSCCLMLACTLSRWAAKRVLEVGLKLKALNAGTVGPLCRPAGLHCLCRVCITVVVIFEMQPLSDRVKTL
jgi:hypothetical protein